MKILAAQKKVFGRVCFEYCENIFAAASQFQCFQFYLSQGRTDSFFSFRIMVRGEDDNDGCDCDSGEVW